MRARLRQSGQLAVHLSGTFVAERPDEQLAPNNPTFNALALYMAARSRIDAVRTNGQAPSGHPGAGDGLCLERNNSGFDGRAEQVGRSDSSRRMMDAAAVIALAGAVAWPVPARSRRGRP